MKNGQMVPSLHILICPATIDEHRWVETAKKAGMKYVVILVAKHHEGFCLSLG